MMPNRKSQNWHLFTQRASGRNDKGRAWGRRLSVHGGWSSYHRCNIILAGCDSRPLPSAYRGGDSRASKLNQIIFADHTHDPAEEIAARLLKVAPPGLDYVFFSDSGSTSVEVALKMALGYWHNIGQQRIRIVVMQHSYHGDMIGAISVGARGVFNAVYGPLRFDVTSIPFPAQGREQATLDALDAACRNEMPAAFIVEPLILGVGGMLMYPAWVLKEMKRICEALDVLFIADEIMTGWGRTGTLFACEQANVTPDIAYYSKGLTEGALPLAVTLRRGDIFDAQYSRDRTRTFFHSSSYTANPVACAAAKGNLEL